jgi:hypothetical protein
MGREIGRRRWAIANGFLPVADPTGATPGPAGYEAAFVLNGGDSDARLEVTVYFEDREPAGPYQVTVSRRRMMPLHLDQLGEPDPIPRGVAYAVVIESSVPIVVQHTRLDPGPDRGAAISTIAWPEPGPLM